MNIRIPQPVRWAASAVVLVLVALIVLQPWRTTHTNDDAATLITTPAALPTASPPRTTPASASASPAMIMVDVIGAVMQPGMYALPEGARVAAAVNAAGGLAPTADREQMNLAAVVHDGEQVRVPKVGDAAGAHATNAASAGTHAALVNINTADAAALEALPGVGPATAKAIVQYRDANGPFTSLDELANVPRLGTATIDKFRDQITIAP